MILNDSFGPTAELLINQNTVVDSCSLDSLYDNQNAVKEELVADLDGGLYNLVGVEGVGKTYLMWALVRESPNWRYFAWLPVTERIEARVVVVDNVPATRTASRRAREVRTFNQVQSVVVISRKPVPEANTFELED